MDAEMLKQLQWGQDVEEKDRVLVKLSDLLVQFSVRDCFSVKRMKDYIVDEGHPELQVEAVLEEIAKEHQITPAFAFGYLEFICLYRRLAEQLPMLQRVVFHGAVITYGQDGFLFTAPSGTGKSTHIKLWRQYLGPAVDIVNGDKPILWIRPEEVRAYGTPWAGKENWQQNCSAPLKGICVLKQAKENKIRRLSAGEALMYLAHQIYMPSSGEAAGATLELLDLLITHVPMYELSCDISEEAVQVCFEAMAGLHYAAFQVKKEDE